MRRPRWATDSQLRARFRWSHFSGITGIHLLWELLPAEPPGKHQPMTDLSLTILPETADDAVAIERLHERTFGPGRYAKSAYRLRERVPHKEELSFTARIGTLLVGSVRLSPIRVGETRALLLGPLTVEPPFRERGIGYALIERALAEAKASGHRLVVLVGDEPYYGKSGFKRIPKGRATMPGPVDPARLLVCELADGAFEGVSGPIRPDWAAS
jgi:predicted N-acetyltransferase YhbS